MSVGQIDPPPPHPRADAFSRPPSTGRNANGVVAGVLIVVGVIVVGAVGIVGLIAWTVVGVVSDDVNPDNSPTIQSYELEHPVMSDVEIDSGKRTDYSRHGGEAGIISLGYATGSWHVQKFEPISGSTLDDVARELVDLATREGYVFVHDDRSWCSAFSTIDQELKYPLGIVIVDTDPLPRAGEVFVPYVSVRLNSLGC